MLRLGSVRARLTLWNTAIVALSLVLFGVTLRLTVQKILYGNIDRVLADRVRPIMEGRPLPGEFRMPPEGRPGPDGFPPGPEGDPPGFGPGPGPDFSEQRQRPRRNGGPGLPPRILDTEGRDLRQQVAVAPWSEPAFRESVNGRRMYAAAEYEGEPVRVLSVPIWRDGRLVGVAQIAERVGPTENALQGINAALLLLIPGVLVVAAGGGLLLTDRALRPVRTIGQAAERISERRLSERLPESGGDEFARLGALLNGMLGRLDSAFTRQRRFTADASHELKTPIAIIKAHSSLALEDDLSPEEYKATLTTIDRAVDRASRVVGDLLQLARMEAGAASAEWSTFPARSLLEEAVEAANLSGDRRVRLDEMGSRLLVRGDRHQLTRLFRNLLENAARYTPEGGWITLSAGREGDDIAVRVRDTGSGIAAEHLPHLFEAFYRADAARARNTGGSGLGLAICKEIAEANGGSISVESAVGAGTTMTVLLRPAD